MEIIVEPIAQSLTGHPARKKIILDCDPGHDDAVALLLAHGNPDIDLLAVTTVVGNQTLEKVTRNALAVGTIAGITGVPFAAGCHRPLVRSIETAPDIHGESGMDGPVLADRKAGQPADGGNSAPAPALHLGTAAHHHADHDRHLRRH